MQVFYSDHYDFPLPASHRFPKSKYALLRRALVEADVLPVASLRAAPLAQRSELVGIHDEDYVDAFLAGRLPDDTMRRIGFPWSKGLVRRTLASVGATGAAMAAAWRDGVSGALSGGTHHAHRDFGAGFCVFNDLAIAAERALREGRAQRVAILDVDVHQGDGTAAIFADEPRVFTCSIHGARNFPLRKSSSDLDLELPDGSDDGTYAAAVAEALAAVSAFQPDLAFVQAGVDPLREDRLGRLAVSARGLAERDRRVFTTLRRARVPTVVTMGGGYADPIARSVDAHVNTYRMAQAVFGRAAPTT